MKILKGDTVLVITGKDKGKKGTVLRVLTSKNRIVVSGINAL
jgi:large subunit ribosomal protein L24